MLHVLSTFVHGQTLNKPTYLLYSGATLGSAGAILAPVRVRASGAHV